MSETSRRNGPPLTILAGEVSGPAARCLGPRPTAAELAEAVRRYLQEHQDWLARRVAVAAGEGCAVVRARLAGGRAGERPLDLLRAVQGLLGMAEKLPELHDEDDLPAIEVAPDEFAVQTDGADEEAFGEDEILRSRVRYFPLPTCEWYEICDGDLLLLPHSVVFKPALAIMPDRELDSRGRQVLPLRRIRAVRADTWWCVPCLRIETEARAYRYGWPALRKGAAGELELDEWIHALRSRLEAQA